MANIEIEKYLTLGASTPLIATSYQVALDEDFTQIIDEIHESVEHKMYWNTPLPKIDGNGFYSDETQIYARVKLFLKNDDGTLFAPDDWYVLPMQSQVDYNLEHRTFTGQFSEEDLI